MLERLGMDFFLRPSTAPTTSTRKPASPEKRRPPNPKKTQKQGGKKTNLTPHISPNPLPHPPIRHRPTRPEPLLKHNLPHHHRHASLPLIRVLLQHIRTHNDGHKVLRGADLAVEARPDLGAGEFGAGFGARGGVDGGGVGEVDVYHFFFLGFWEGLFFFQLVICGGFLGGREWGKVVIRVVFLRGCVGALVGAGRGVCGDGLSGIGHFVEDCVLIYMYGLKGGSDVKLT